MVGKTLSHYKILEELGRGGMGIVYKAEDAKLHRTVALKVLPLSALGNEEDRARFFREAQAAAQLHHANIATVFAIEEAASDDGTQQPFIAMEYIDGETLTEKISRGPLKLDEAVEVATQVAVALELAHEKNIVHRDIKSGNVMLTSRGVAKVLDFGLAKTAQSTKLTQLGSTLGTIAYMSPEQARGEEVDRRSDIWSLGVLLYEMLSGRLPFASEYEQAAVYSILNEDPEPLTAIRTGVPMALELLVGKCLSKNADQRYQSVTDLLVDLKSLELRSKQLSKASGAMVQQSTISPAPAVGTSSKTSTVPIVIVGVMAFVLGALALYFLQPNQPRTLRKFEYPAPGVTALAISHAGDRYAYVQNDTLYVRDLSSLSIRSLTAASAIHLFWSPDDAHIGYAESQSLWTIDPIGGEPRLLTSFDAGTIHGATWLPSDHILVSVRTGTAQGTIHSIPASGGNSEIIWETDVDANVNSFDALASSATNDLVVVNARDFEDVESIRLLDSSADVILIEERNYFPDGIAISPDGHLLISEPSMGLTSHTFASDKRSIIGNSVRIAPPGARFPSVSNDGILTYVQFELVDLQIGQFSNDGEIERSFGRPGQLMIGPLVHPNEDRVLIAKSGGGIWLMDSRGSETPIDTGFTGTEVANTWLKDGRRVIISSFRDGGTIVVVDVTGRTLPQRIVSGRAWFASLSRDEQYMAFYVVTDDNRRDLFYVELDVQPDSIIVGEWNAYLNTPADEAVPQFHPDGDLLLYQTNLSGRWQLVVRTFPDPNENYWPITIDGGKSGRWHPNGRMIYYTTEDGMLWRIPFDRTSVSPVGKPEELFSIYTHTLNPYKGDFDLSPISGSLIAIHNVREPGPPSIVVVENWSALLER